MNSMTLIPDAAYDAGGDAALDYLVEGLAFTIAREVIRAAAPIIVIAELRRVVDELNVILRTAPLIRGEWGLPSRAPELAYAIDRVRARIDALSVEIFTSETGETK